MLTCDRTSLLTKGLSYISKKSLSLIATFLFQIVPGNFGVKTIWTYETKVIIDIVHRPLENQLP